MPVDVGRRTLLMGAFAAAVPLTAVRAAEPLSIGAGRGTIDFAIGDSRIFRTTGTFKDWRGFVHVDEEDVPKSAVEVVVRTGSIEMLDQQQTAMLKDVDFFDVVNFPEMRFRSAAVERTGESALKVQGFITLRGITKPMVLEVSVTDRRPDAPPGKRYAHFRGSGAIKRSEFGMTKFVDVVGDTVDIIIRTDAWR